MRRDEFWAAISSLVVLGACTQGEPYLASVYVKSQVISASQGGTITVTAADSPVLAGTQLVVPANALATDTRITVGFGGGPGHESGSAPTSASLAAPGGQKGGPIVYFGPDGTTFLVPVSVTVPFSQPAGATASELVVDALESDGQTTYQIPNASLHISGSLVTFSASGFTQFGADYVPPPPDAGGCGMGLTDCGGGNCVDLTSDSQNCGACGVQCPSGVCSGNTCTAVPDGGPDAGDAGPDAGGCAVNQTVEPDGGCCWGTVAAGPCGLPGVAGNADCCTGFVCTSSNFCVAFAVPDSGMGPDAGGCTNADAGDACDTTADCNTSQGLVCSATASATSTGPAGGGTCEAPATVLANCSVATTACGAAGDKVCCGLCVNGFCQDLGSQTCSAIAGSSCLGDPDCCTGFHCVVLDGGPGVCLWNCGQTYATCDPANNNGDCCTDLGFTCVSGALPAGGNSFYGANFCYNNFNAGAASIDCSPDKCGPDGGTEECLLGTPCLPTAVTGAATDSCQAAGLVCDPNLYVCRNPDFFEPCIPGGPSCNLIAGTNADSLVCVNYAPLNAGNSNPGNLCLEACQTNADCLSPAQSCQATSVGNFCFVNSNPACTDYFGTCNAGGTNDGICFAITASGTTFSSCYQATFDGGGPGTACGINANRQNPSFCDTSDMCLGGVCEPVCNTSGADHTCSGTNTICVQDPAFGAGVSVLGACSTSCAIDDPDGGGCVTTGAGVATKCYPGELYSAGLFADNGTGFCGAESSAPLAVGQPCFGGDPSVLDPCVAGAVCVGSSTSGFFCSQLCTNVGMLCPDGVKTCTSLNGLTMSGYCF